jgi:uncharacterized peroxidase-related enzyme
MRNTMAFIETTPPEAAEGDVAAMYRRQQANWGFIPNYAKVFSLRPDVLTRWSQLQTEIRRTLDKRRFELVTFVAALELGNSACALVHGKVLREFFSDAQILAIAEDRCNGILSAAEQAVVAFARQTARDASCTTAGQVAALKQHGFSDAEIFDIAAVAAARAFFAKLLDALGTLPDSALLALDESFRRPLTVGRPIDERESVGMVMPEPFDR